MNETITIDGNDYEVLTHDRICEITHARMGGGDIVESWHNELNDVISVPFKNGDYRLSFGEASIKFLGIQPLKLIERKPVEFVADVMPGFGGTKYIAIPDNVPVGMKFRCVQITEES